MTETQTMLRDMVGNPVVDGPSTTLLNFMATHNFVAPRNWKGYRELTEK
jgi:hypothetical protein